MSTRLTQVVTVATTAILPNSPTYANGSAGVGATLTAGSAGVLTIDGQATALGDRILVKNQASTVQNGIYSVTTAGTAGIPYVLTRITGYDSGAEITGAPAIQIGAGAANGFTSWIMNAGTVTTVGTDPITYVMFTVAASAVGTGTVTSITAGTGLSGGTITNTGTISLPSQPYTLAAFASGVLTASQVLLVHQHPAAVTYPANFGASTSGGSSRAASLANATASTVLTVSQCLAASDPTNGANFGSIGSITFAAGGHAGTFVTSGAVAFAAGDFLKISGPSSADATLASVAVTLVGNR